MNKLGTINPISQTSVTEIDKVLEGVTIKHDIVSDIDTPKAYIKKKMDMDYVEVGYMKKIADKHYPGWSWEVIKTEFAGTQAYVVHGRLKWYDSGIQRTGDMTAAHRIQRKRGTEEYVDLGNDIKAANTDCMKKAFNMYMNIADDVYRNQVEDTELTDKQVADLIKVALGVSEEKASEINIMVEEGVIHGLNYKGALAKLKRQGQK
ncbi:MAG: hypothetical protein HN564_02050 [Flavobacteriales bacterium]|nr:hypothetical protein [Flavobacteriales bacterium]